MKRRASSSVALILAACTFLCCCLAGNRGRADGVEKRYIAVVVSNGKPVHTIGTFSTYGGAAAALVKWGDDHPSDLRLLNILVEEGPTKEKPTETRDKKTPNVGLEMRLKDLHKDVFVSLDKVMNEKKQDVESAIKRATEAKEFLTKNVSKLSDDSFRDVNKTITQFNALAKDLKASGGESFAGIRPMTPLSPQALAKLGPEGAAALTKDAAADAKVRLDDIRLRLERKELAEQKDALEAAAAEVGRARDAGVDASDLEGALKKASVDWEAKRSQLEREAESQKKSVNALTELHDQTKETLHSIAVEKKRQEDERRREEERLVEQRREAQRLSEERREADRLAEERRTKANSIALGGTVWTESGDDEYTYTKWAFDSDNTFHTEHFIRQGRTSGGGYYGTWRVNEGKIILTFKDHGSDTAEANLSGGSLTIRKGDYDIKLSR
jgi:hypothetical protein